MIAPVLPHGQAAWHAFALELNARLSLLQIHWEPDWLFCLCTRCGWDLELSRPHVARFRFEVTNHSCEPAQDALPPLLPVVVDFEEVLF